MNHNFFVYGDGDALSSELKTVFDKVVKDEQRGRFVCHQPKVSVGEVIQWCAARHLPFEHNVTIEAKRQMVRDLLNEMKGLQVFGVVDEQGNPLPKEGLIFVYRNRLIAVGKEVEDLGTFIPALSTMTLEEHCMYVWEEHFGNKEE